MEKKKKEKYSHGAEEICKVDRRVLEKDFSTQKRALLGFLFKAISVDGKSMEDPRSIPKAPGVIMYLGDSGCYLKGLSHLFERKDAFSEICVIMVGSPEMKNFQDFV